MEIEWVGLVYVTLMVTQEVTQDGDNVISGCDLIPGGLSPSTKYVTFRERFSYLFVTFREAMPLCLS